MGQTSIPDQIIEQATRLFSARGFDGVSVQEIADAVGVSKPSLLYHFPSKDELRRRVLEKILAHWNEVLPRLLKAAVLGERQFEALIRETVAFFAADPDRARLLLREVLDRPQALAGVLATAVRPWVEAISSTIRKGQKEGRVRRDVDPEAYVTAVVNLALSTIAVSRCTGALARPGTRAEDALARHVKEVLRVARSSLFDETEPK